MLKKDWLEDKTFLKKGAYLPFDLNEEFFALLNYLQQNIGQNFAQKITSLEPTLRLWNYNHNASRVVDKNVFWNYVE
jgi:hypothetical protein